jgi:hypothetical protein
VVCGLLAAPAQASFHLMKIREIFTGTSATSDADYIVLQATAAGQNLLMSHSVRFYQPDGTQLGACSFPSNPSAAANQQFYLAAQSPAVTMFGVAADCPYAAGNALQATGGAVCWDATFIDCMAYGTFNNSVVQLPVGTPTPVPPDGMALTRTIARGCPTALDDADDTNDSAADFSVATPNPRNSGSPITEKPCAGVGVGGKPNTKIKKRPKNKSDDDSPTFKFKSTESGSTFKCKLDHKPFKKCKSPKTYHGVDPGKHTFKVEAIDADGNIDKSPAKDKFKILP